MGMDFNVNVNVKTNGAEKIDALEAKIKSLKTQPINLKVNVDSKSLNVTNLGSQLQSSFANAGTSAGKAYNTALQNQINAMAKTQQTAFSQPLNNITKQQQSYISWWEKALNSQQKSFSQLDATTASNKTLTWLKNNSKAAKDYGDKLKYLASQQRLATSGEELKGYTKQISAIQAEAAALGKTGRSVTDELSRGFKKIGQFALTYGVIQRLAYQVPRQIFSAVLQVDTAMTNLYKVTDETNAKYTEFLDNAGKSAKELGRNISSYVEQTANWAKLGYSIDQSAELAKVSSIYANVGEVDDKTAVSDLVTVLKAYNMQDSQAMNIADMLNELGEQNIAHVA